MIQWPIECKGYNVVNDQLDAAAGINGERGDSGWVCKLIVSKYKK